MSIEPGSHGLWPTPIGVHRYPDAAKLNPLLVEAVRAGACGAGAQARHRAGSVLRLRRRPAASREDPRVAGLRPASSWRASARPWRTLRQRAGVGWQGDGAQGRHRGHVVSVLAWRLVSRRAHARQLLVVVGVHRADQQPEKRIEAPGLRRRQRRDPALRPAVHRPRRGVRQRRQRVPAAAASGHRADPGAAPAVSVLARASGDALRRRQGADHHLLQRQHPRRAGRPAARLRRDAEPGSAPLRSARPPRPRRRARARARARSDVEQRRALLVRCRIGVPIGSELRLAA